MRKRWFTPPWGTAAGITLYPFIFVREGHYSTILLRHEFIHVLQVIRDGWWTFYLSYLWRQLRGKKHAVEIEAYKYQKDPTYLPSNLEALVHSHMENRGGT